MTTTNDPFAEHHFNREKKMMESELKELETYQAANEFLRKHDWLFISPLFFQGYQIQQIFELSKLPGDQKAAINQLIFRKFYNLNWTASFVEGYCSRCTHIEPFLPSIENSLILVFQRDYEGAIKTLIPIVEGVLRKYLLLERGMTNPAIQFKHLKKAFLDIKEDLLKKIETGLTNREDENKKAIVFSTAQKEELLRLHTAYEDQWFSFITEFIDKSLYLNTHHTPITNELNRHAILHEYGLNINYNLENFIKVYFVLYFLTWAFLKKEGKSLLNQVDTIRWFEKAEAYKRIILNAEKNAFDKHILLKNFAGYRPEFLRDTIAFAPIKVPVKLLRRYLIINRFRKYFWKKGLPF